MRALRVVLFMLLMPAVLYALACIGVYLSQRSLIYHPVPAAAGGAGMDLQADGATLRVGTRELPGPEAVIYFGGNAEDVSASRATLAQAFPNQSLYLMHYRGYGASTGKPSEAALVADARILFDQVHVRHPNVTLIGRSLGSGVALHLASERPAARVVLVTPYDSLADIAAGYYPLLPVRLLMTDRFDSWRYVAGVRAPVTAIVAERDEVIPRANTEQLLRRFAPGQLRSVVIAGAGHNDLSSQPGYMAALQGR